MSTDSESDKFGRALAKAVRMSVLWASAVWLTYVLVFGAWFLILDPLPRTLDPREHMYLLATCAAAWGVILVERRG